MTLQPALIAAAAAGYLGLLFLLAWLAERQAARGRLGLVDSPAVYTLSLAVYCTSWTYYGAVGWASERGIEYTAIYFGPTLVFVGWTLFLRKLVRIAKAHRITSVADFISSRFGKSPALSVLATVIALLAATPYIALQLKAVTASFEAVTGASARSIGAGFLGDTGFWVAGVMALFSVLFGVRRLNADERHPGVVAAIAFGALLKFVALGAVAIYAVFVVFGGVEPMIADAVALPAFERIYRLPENFENRWMALSALSAAAVVCLPRQFHIAVVEAPDERRLRMASWAFPLYLLCMCLFVLPIAMAGAQRAPSGNPDLYVLLTPLADGQRLLAMLAFVGGLAAATSMVVVSSIALSIMISNHLVAPVLLRRGDFGSEPGAAPRALMNARRVGILIVFILGYAYYQASTAAAALAEIGLISFVGAAQFLPALIGGVVWRGATKVGAMLGLAIGFALWCYTLALPTLAAAGVGFDAVLRDGLFGIAALRPQALMGVAGEDPLIHAMVWSLGANLAFFILGSLATRPGPMESLQGAMFVDAYERPAVESGLRRSARAVDLYRLVERILGPEQAREAFAHDPGDGGEESDGRLIADVERLLAGSLGAATAQTLVAQVAQGEPMTSNAVFALLEETRQAIQHSLALEKKSEELRRTAEELRRANVQLRRVDQMKDDFLSRVSHELRTPMTSILSFSEILVSEPELDPARTRRFIRIIDQESRRLTRLLDEILDLGRLESGRVEWTLAPVDAVQIARDAVDAMRGLAERRNVELRGPDGAQSVIVLAEPDRLKQIFINLLSNAIKFNDAESRWVALRVAADAETARFVIEDNGPGVRAEDRTMIFAKFSRGWRAADDEGGSGLGLVISRQIARVFGGDVTLLEPEAPTAEDSRGAAFELRLPRLSARTPEKSAAVSPPAA